MNPPANWYPDPTGRHEQRYWDGTQWTEHVFTGGAQGVDPLESSASATGEDTQTADESAATAVAAAASAEASSADDGPDAEQVDSDEDLFGTHATPATVPSTHVADADAPTGDDDVTDLWTPGTDPTRADEEQVAPEVEAGDVVATLDEVEDTTQPPDEAPDEAADEFADAFVLSPETASRLVGARATAPEVEPDDEQDTPTGDDLGPGDEQDEDAPTGAIDAPPPSVPPVAAPPADAPAPEPAGLGITGELVGGTFAEREDQGPVALQNTRLLRCRVDASSGVVARQGTMVAYQGDVSFERQGAGGVGRALKRAATGEGLAMMRIGGSGDVFFADGAQHVFLLHLDGGPGISVNGRNVLAFSAALAWDIERVKGATLLAGGLFNTTLTGTGWVALVSDGEPVVLRPEDAPTYVDVNALVAWSAGLQTRVVNTVSARSLVGLGSGEAFQMAFDGAGVVIVQPSEGPTAGAAAT